MIGTECLTKSAAANAVVGQVAASAQEVDRFIREPECHRISGLSRVTRWRLERSGKFPERRQISDNAVAWLLSEVLAWRDARSSRTSEAA